jgi:type I restriction enzyme S subunit
VADVKAQMMADVKVQMVAIMKSVGSRGFETKKLSDVCEFVGGKGNYTNDGDAYPYYDSNGITGTRKDFLYDGEYIITARKMSIGAVHYASGKFWPSDNTIVMRVKPDSNILISRFLYYWLLMNNDILKAMTSGIKPGIRKSDVVEIKMPIPPIEFQRSVLKRMQELDSQQQSIIALQKQTEDNARFILESYLTQTSEGEGEGEGEEVENTITHV